MTRTKVQKDHDHLLRQNLLDGTCKLENIVILYEIYNGLNIISTYGVPHILFYIYFFKVTLFHAVYYY